MTQNGSEHSSTGNETGAPKSNNHTAGLLSILAKSGDKWVQLGTLVLIALSGVGNWVATWHSSTDNREQIEKGEQRIRAELIEEFHKGNEDSAANRKMLNQLLREDLDGFERRQLTVLDNQNKMMQNQSQILENDTALIRETHAIVEKFNRWKQAEQMRGAPP